MTKPLVNPLRMRYERLLERVDDKLSPKGFKRSRGQFYSRDGEGNWGFITFQPHKLNSSRDFSFTYGVQVSSWKILSFYDPDRTVGKRPKVDEFHWSRGLTNLKGGLHSDWLYVQTCDDEQLYSKVARDLDALILPALYRHWTDQQLIHHAWHYREGFKRRAIDLVHLAILQCVHGDGSLADTVEELEDRLHGNPNLSVRPGLRIVDVIDRIHGTCPGLLAKIS